MTIKKVGLTGGIGSGKSTVSKLFRSNGIETIDADQIARDLTQPGTVEYKNIVKAFGDKVILDDGNLNRKLLGEIVFSDSRLRNTLEDILHPPIKKTMHLISDGFTGKYCIMEIPLLIETEQHKEMDRVLLVSCQLDQRIKRLKSSRGLDEETIRKVFSSQMSDSEKAKYSDEIISNDGTLETLKNDVNKLHQKYLTLF